MKMGFRLSITERAYVIINTISFKKVVFCWETFVERLLKEEEFAEVTWERPNPGKIVIVSNLV